MFCFGFCNYLPILPTGNISRKLGRSLEEYPGVPLNSSHGMQQRSKLPGLSQYIFRFSEDHSAYKANGHWGNGRTHSEWLELCLILPPSSDFVLRKIQALFDKFSMPD